MPPKQWTAWPLREKNVPREHLVKRQDDEDEQKKKESVANGPVTAESLESERNGMDALLDGE